MAENVADDIGYAPARWAFDDEVTRVFDQMLRRSIPRHDDMRRVVFDIASRYAKPGTAIVDLGCSRGEAMAAFIDRFGAHNRHVGVEVSPPMLAAARQRFKGLIDCGVVAVREMDLREAYPPDAASVTLAVLTLQFVPIEYRQRVVRRAYQHTATGGCLVVVEKVLGSTAEVDEALAALYCGHKRDHGYSQDDIDRKRLSLEGVLVPVTARWNEEMLAAAGFRHVDCFWRHLNFAAWLAVKD